MPDRALRTLTFVFARAAVYSALFIGFLLIFLPARILAGAGVVGPPALGPMKYAGILLTAAGATLCIACILTFVSAGRGTPAPFDPPRRLVVRGPYRVIRNPMYLGAAIALGGAAAYYGSLPLLGYAVSFLIVMHLFVVVYEEPALRRTFGAAYDEYCNRTGRWS